MGVRRKYYCNWCGPGVADDRHRRLLRTQRAWGRRRAAEQEHQLAPPHWITLHLEGERAVPVGPLTALSPIPRRSFVRSAVVRSGLDRISMIFAGFSAGWLFRSIDQYWESVKRDISWSLNAGAGCTHPTRSGRDPRFGHIGHQAR